MSLFSRLEQLSDRARLFWILAAGTILRFVGISHSSIWHDEGYTMMITPRPFAEIVADTARDVHPPLYYFFLHVWIRIFGSSEIGARSMSAVFSLATVAVVFFLVRRLFNRNIAVVAALFTALAPFMIRYSQEARMYAMIAFFTTAATYALIRAMERPKNYRLWWVLYAVLVLCSIYTQYFGFFVLMVHWIYVGMRTVLQTGKLGLWERVKSFLMEGWWWAANAVILLGFLPWIPILINQLTRVNNAFWIQQQWITVNTVPDTVYTFFAYIHLDSPFPQIFLLRDVPFALLVLLVGWAIWRWRGGFTERSGTTAVPTTWRETLFFLLYFLLPMVLVWGVSKLKRPIYQDRYFPFAAIGFYIAMAFGAWALRKSWARRGLIAVFVVIMLLGNIVVYHETNHKMRVTGHFVTEHFTPGDEIISLDVFTFFDFSYYNHTGTPAKLYGPTINFTYDEPGLLARRPDLQVRTLTTVDPPTHRVWIIGKTGSHDYYQQIPSWWQLVGQHEAGYTEARLYKT